MSTAKVARAIDEVREAGRNTLPIILNHLGLKTDSRVLDVSGFQEESRTLLTTLFDGPIDAVGKWDPEQRVAAAKGGRVRPLAGVPDAGAVQYDLVLLCPVMTRTLSDLRAFVSAHSGVVAPGGYLIAHGVLPGAIGNSAFIQPPPPVAQDFAESFSVSAGGRLDLPACLAEYRCCGMFRRTTKSRSFLAWYVLRRRSDEELRALSPPKPVAPAAAPATAPVAGAARNGHANGAAAAAVPAGRQAALQPAADEETAAELARSIAEIPEAGRNTLPVILNHLGLKADSRVLDVGGAARGGQESMQFLLEAFAGPVDAIGRWDPEQRVAAARSGRVRPLAGVPNAGQPQYDLVLLCPATARTLSELRAFVTAHSGVVAPGGYLIAHGVLPGAVDNPAFTQPPPAVARDFAESFLLSPGGGLVLPAYLAEYRCCGVFRRTTKSRSFLAWYVLRRRSAEELRTLVPPKPAAPAAVTARKGQANGPAAQRPVVAVAAGTSFAARTARLSSQVMRLGPPEYDAVLRELVFEEVPADVAGILQSQRFDSVMFVNNRFTGDARPMKMVQALADFGRKPLAVGVNSSGEYGVEEIAGTIPLVLLPNYNALVARKVREFELPPDVGPRYELWMAATAVCLANLLIELSDKPPLLILHSHDFTGGYVGGNVAALARAAPEMARTAIKWIHDIHEFVREYDIIDPTLQQIACAWEGAFYPRADALLTVTAPLSDRICHFYDVRTPPAVVYNCNRLSAKHKYKGPGCREVSGCGDAPLIVHSGSIKAGRGVEYLIRAMAQRRDLHMMLITGSESEYVSQLLAEADQLGVRERVHLHPLLPYDEVAGFIAEADAGMIPMDHYGNANVSLPNKFFDYINAELPVISADTDNLRELMTDWPVGRLFPAGDVAALTAAIDDIIGQPEKYRAAIRSRPDLILGFSWETQAVKLYDIYCGLARGRPGRYHLQLPEY